MAAEHERLTTALIGLRHAIAEQGFDLPDPRQATRRAQRDRLVAELDGHLARLGSWDAPLLVVVGGGTGAGKSTLVNSLIGHAVAATGVIRPTTSSPTVLMHPRDERWFTDERVLASLPRVRASDDGGAGTGGARQLHLVPSNAIPAGLAILDAPDVDSVRTANRELADLLLDAADVWVWLVTARTYADEASMDYLRRAARRRTALTVVLSQVHDRDAPEVMADLHRKLAAEGLTDVSVFVVPFARVEGQRLPERAISEVRTWLRSLSRTEARDSLRRQTLQGALDDVAHEVDPLVAAVADEQATTARLDEVVQRELGSVPELLRNALGEGVPLRQEVLARWRDFVGTNRFLSMVESATGMVRGWVQTALARVTSVEEARVQDRVRTEIADTVAGLVVDSHQVAIARTVARWEDPPAGERLLADRPELRTASPALRERAEQAVAEWQDAVTALIETTFAERRVRARWLSTVVNAAATAAILAAFASTGGLTTAEAGIAAGAGATNQALLVKLLGAQNVRWLVDRVTADLLDHSAAVAEQERRRYADALAAVSPAGDETGRLREALEALTRARAETETGT